MTGLAERDVGVVVAIIARALERRAHDVVPPKIGRLAQRAPGRTGRRAFLARVVARRALRHAVVVVPVFADALVGVSRVRNSVIQRRARCAVCVRAGAARAAGIIARAAHLCTHVVVLRLARALHCC